uniref:Recombinase family protein n=1 Tax=Bradyrhizobium quebecense TaxID=2748629 RepID=A0A973WWL2_9BRAD
MKAAIYARFSDKDKQTDKSIDDQVALCRTMCERDGLMVVEVYSDHGISGASTVNRLGLQRLMRDAKAGKFAVVVSESLDRISRDQEDLAGIHKRLNFARVEIRTFVDNTVGEIHVGVKGLVGALYLKDLAQKTRRGQAGVVRDGRHNGGRSFGYRPVLGRRGELEIDEAEAQTVRRIFDLYIDGNTPRDIAARLNREHIAGPRGGVWNASTIGGSRTRRNGILQNDLYDGRIIWNRQSFVKDPETGKRISRPNPRDQWITAEAEHLRIIDAKVWQTAQGRVGDRAGTPHKARPTHLLSGLVKCGKCGSGMIACGTDKRGVRLMCSRRRETGLCDNATGVPRVVVEERVLKGIEHHLADPDLVAEYVAEYHRMSRELNSRAAVHIRTLEKRLTTVNTAINRLVDAIVSGTPARAVQDRLAALEAERDEIERERAGVGADPVEFHPNAANAYRLKIRSLKKWLADSGDEARQAAFAGIREIIEKVTIHPRRPGEPVGIEIDGQLAAILRLSDTVTGAGESQGAMVAGIGFEPMTFRL